MQVSAADLTRISKGKAFKSLVEKGELEVQEIPDEEPKAGGKTGTVVVKVVNKTMQQVSSKSQLMKMLYAVKAELTALEVTFSDDETLEQLQAKLAQAKE